MVANARKRVQTMFIIAIRLGFDDNLLNKRQPARRKLSGCMKLLFVTPENVLIKYR